MRVWREVKVRHAGGEATRAMATRARDLIRQAGWHGEVRIFGDRRAAPPRRPGAADPRRPARGVPGASWCIPGHAPHVRDRIAAVNGRLRTWTGTTTSASTRRVWA